MFAFEKTFFLQEEGIGAFALGEAGMRLVLNGISFETVALQGQSAIFDLMLMMGEVKGSLLGAFQYNVALFDEATIERMKGHWERLLEGIAGCAESRIEDLAMLSAAERQQILREWNQTKAEWGEAKSLVELFERQAERHPEKLAVVSGNQQLSYGELNE